MHEKALMTELIRVAETTLADYSVEKVNSVTVKVGALAGVLPQAFSFAFDALTPGTSLGGARLIMQKFAAVVRCGECFCEYEPASPPFSCPFCGSCVFKIIKGEEVFIESIDAKLRPDSERKN